MIPGLTTQRVVQAGDVVVLESDGLADGPAEVSVTRDGGEAEALTVTIDCAGDAPTPVPQPTPIPGQPDGQAEVRHVVSCLALNGRVDTNVVNLGDDAATYRIEFEGLSDRSASVAARDWWRMPITGRADGDYDVTVTRNGQVVSEQTVTVDCDSASPQVSDIEVDVVNACRFGNGYLLFQMVNPTAAPRSWVIEFEGVPNRSTSAPGYGAAVRAVTGRQDGDHDWLVRIGGQTIASGTVSVDC